MAQEEVKYTIPSAGGSGSNVDVTFTTGTTANADGSFTVTAASGTYQTLDANGKVVDNDTITGVAPVGTLQGDNELFISADPTVSPIVTLGGITYSISNPADGDMGDGEHQFLRRGRQQRRNDADRYRAGRRSAHILRRRRDQQCAVGDCNRNRRRLLRSGHVDHHGTGASGRRATFDQRHGRDRVRRASSDPLDRAPARWIAAGHSRPQDVMPVRIAAHAFGGDRPSRDLVVSPGHALCIEASGEVLIPAFCPRQRHDGRAGARRHRHILGMSNSTNTAFCSPRTCRRKATSRWAIALSSPRPPSSISQLFRRDRVALTPTSVGLFTPAARLFDAVRNQMRRRAEEKERATEGMAQPRPHLRAGAAIR